MGFSPRHEVGVIVLTNRFRSVEHYGNWLLRRAVELYAEPARAARPPALSPASPAEYRLAISGG